MCVRACCVMHSRHSIDEPTHTHAHTHSCTQCGNSIEDYVARELELLGPARAQQLIGAERYVGVVMWQWLAHLGRKVTPRACMCRWKEGRLVRTRKRRCLHAATSLCRGRRCVVVVCRGPGTLLSTVTAVIQGVLLVVVAALLVSVGCGKGGSLCSIAGARLTAVVALVTDCC